MFDKTWFDEARLVLDEHGRLWYIQATDLQGRQALQLASMRAARRPDSDQHPAVFVAGCLLSGDCAGAAIGVQLDDGFQVVPVPDGGLFRTDTGFPLIVRHGLWMWDDQEW